jgi:predicted metal-binding protein
VTKQKETPRALGQPTSGDDSKADLECYRKLALEMGATDAVIIPSSSVPVDERVRLKCFVPRCQRAGETPNCPPYYPDLGLVRRALNRFSWAILFKCNVETLGESFKGDSKTKRHRILSFHQGSNQIIYELERRAYKDGYDLALGFGGGSCKDYLCEGLECQFLDSGRCRFPNRARPSMESMGIHVIELIKKVG